MNYLLGASDKLSHRAIGDISENARCQADDAWCLAEAIGNIVAGQMVKMQSLVGHFVRECVGSLMMGNHGGDHGGTHVGPHCAAMLIL